MGFQDDPFDNIGRLQAELFRAVRLVVDTGIHSKRWTREQARTALGDKFDVRDFHEVVLKNGPVPLHVLRDLVMDYIGQVNSRSG